MTDNDIIKALECCCNTKSFGCPHKCPLYEYDGVCWDVVKRGVLSLINRQKAEIERLNAGIERLADESDARDIDEYNMVCRVRAEAIKEFAERLKEKLGNGG